MIQSSIGDRSRLILASSGEVFSTTFDAGQRSRELALQSVVEKFGVLPSEAGAFGTFETTDGRVRAERAITDELDAWSLRFSEPDKTTAGRDWIVEVSSLNSSSRSQFSCRLSCYSADRNFGFIPATPRAMKDVVAAMSFVNSGYVLTSEVQEVGIDISIDELVQQLEEQARWWNCLVVAESFTSNYGLDASIIHRYVTGCANTFFLPTDLETEFASKVGREFTVFGGGARSFRPNFSSSLSEQTAHPVIKAPFSGSRYGIGRAHHILASDAFHSSVERQDLRTLVPSFATVRQFSTKLLSESARKSGNSHDIISTLEARLAAEEKNAAESVQFAIQYDEERKVTQAKLENEQAINYGLQQRIETLEAKLHSSKVSTQTAAPKDYDEIGGWVIQNFSGKLRLLPRAEKALKSAKYEKFEDVVSGLELLAGKYRLLKMGRCEPNDFEAECAKCGFNESKSISRTSAGQHGEEYFVDYSGERRFLERHLTKGTAKDARYCLRIYYFWDEASELVVVGSLPEHLKTNAT